MNRIAAVFALSPCIWAAVQMWLGAHLIAGNFFAHFAQAALR